MYLALLAVAALAPSQQTELVQKYCAVCHTDTFRNGGLSLQHFSASRVDPSLAAMMLSKLTGGLSVATATAAASDPQASALLSSSMKGGAMGAAGIPIPDKATIDNLIATFAAQARGATEWTVTPEAAVVRASMLREVPSASSPGAASMYRLIVSCNADTREGDMQLAWSPSPKDGTLDVAVDGKPPVTFAVEGRESMGNGSKAITGPAATTMQTATLAMPQKSLVFSNLFPNQSVTFPFDTLPVRTRQSIAPCFN